ncbi:GGDEF domain-containing protein [Jiella sp. MQZ9-1]|uniref:diguanylate cyclase n=1 Tax=Jiella flava TaxID=2816857 RepID=A0A939JWJ5_9HYPH|nr:GGDEF domain-containing protein [Jiella flava]MBO0662376.1 GGDEF domain-containing protein [Jiella flava]MCD2471600.1 GGDEF domain-containing protein [Jiella flava]
MVESGVLVLLDIDYFKRVNDTYGHPIGDACLQAVAQRLQELVRKGEIVARFGGEEFALILVEGGIEAARLFGERLAEGICFKVYEIGGGQFSEVVVTLSGGAAILHPKSDLRDLLSRADKALYEAKQGGRARLYFVGRKEPLFIGTRTSTLISRVDAALVPDR